MGATEMIRNLMAVLLIASCVVADEPAWTLTTPSFKGVKVNGSSLKNAPFWEFERFNQIETGNTDAMIFKTGHLYLKVFKNSLVRYSDSVLQLVSGRIYIKAEATDLTFQVPTFFKFRITPGDFLAEHDLKIKNTMFEILSKPQVVQIDSDDREMSTPEGTKLVFQAELVDGDIAYDFLLNDRKIPKLKMEKHKIDKPLLLDSNLWTASVKKAAEAKKKQVKKAAIDNTKYICKKPNGILSTCAFVQESLQCIRYTCNLSGEWTQRTVFSKSDLCPKVKTVKDCEWISK
jgi:hypothetical protein